MRKKYDKYENNKNSTIILLILYVIIASYLILKNPIEKITMTNYITTSTRAKKEIWDMIRSYEKDGKNGQKIVKSYKIDTNSIFKDEKDMYHVKAYFNEDKELYLEFYLLPEFGSSDFMFNVSHVSKKFNKIFELDKFMEKYWKKLKEKEKEENEEKKEEERLSKIAKKEVIENKKFEKQLWKYFKNPGVIESYWDENMNLKKRKLDIKSFNYDEKVITKSEDSNYYWFNIYFNGNKESYYYVDITRDNSKQKYKIKIYIK